MSRGRNIIGEEKRLPFTSCDMVWTAIAVGKDVWQLIAKTANFAFKYN